MLPYLDPQTSTLRRLAYILCTAGLLLMLAATSAAGAHGQHSAGSHAGRHASHRHKSGRHDASRRHKSGRHVHRKRAHHRPAAAFKASTTAATTLLGDEALESNRDSLNAGQAEAFPFQASTSATTGAAHVYVDYHDAAKALIVGLYTNLNGHPGSLLTTGSLFAPVAGAWNTAALAPASLASGTTYWLAVLGTGGTLRYRDRAQGPCKAETSAQTTLAALASSWKTGKLYSTCPVSGYVSAAAATLPESPPVEVLTVESPPPPPPPAAPTNSSPPSISGTATEGQLLSASTGVWTESPTSYAYQWQDCDSAGASCVSVSGATASSYKLSAGDVGHTVRVVVTASNAGGSTSASSAATAAVLAAFESEGLLVGSSTVQPSGDTSSAGSAEAFQYTATAGGTVRSLELYVNSGSSAPKIVVGLYSNVSSHPGTLLTSATIGSPVAGAWNAVAVPSVAISSGSSYWLAALAPSGTLALRDVASGGGPTQSSASSTLTELPASWSSGSSWANSPASFYASGAVVSPPPAPVNTALPVIGGTAAEGQTLSVSNGSWANGPTSFAYQWQDCNTLGEGCANVSGATGSTYRLGSTDVGHTVRALVTATSSSGSATAASEHTAVVAEGGGGGGGGTQTTDCFGKEEACGYPGPEDTGVEKGVTLVKHAGSVTVGEAGATIRDERIEGNLEIAASNVTVENVEVVTSSQRKVCEKTGSTEGSGGLQVREHGGALSTGVVIRHVTVHGVTQGCPESLAEGITMRESSSAADVRVEWSKVYWTRTCFFQSATWENDYCNDNGAIPGAHYDGIYDNGEGTTGGAKPGLLVKHNTILMPHWQTAPLFLPNEKEVGEERIEDNFLAGGGYLMYLAGAHGATPAVIGPVEVIGNRFARCLGATVSSKTGGHHLCEGLAEENETTSEPLAPDGFGYFPQGGSYGVLYSTYDAATDHFVGNYWDDNLQAAL